MQLRIEINWGYIITYASRVKVEMQLSNRRVATKHLPSCISPIT